MNHNHAVWPTGVPPVTTALWCQDSWQKFEDSFRPAGYTGGRHDQAAWDAYAKGVREQAAEAERLRWHNSILKYHGQEVADRWLEANREANRCPQGLTPDEVAFVREEAARLGFQKGWDPDMTARQIVDNAWRAGIDIQFKQHLVEAWVAQENS